MIEFRAYHDITNILNARVEAYAVMVNILGQYEHSLSASFFNFFPEYGSWYLNKCRNYEIKIGRAYPYFTGMDHPSCIISVGYKRAAHTTIWLPNIIKSIKALGEVIDTCGFESVAIQVLGYKMNYARWGVLKQTYLSELGNKKINIFLYANKKLSF